MVSIDGVQVSERVEVFKTFAVHDGFVVSGVVVDLGTIRATSFMDSRGMTMNRVTLTLFGESRGHKMTLGTYGLPYGAGYNHQVDGDYGLITKLPADFLAVLEDGLGVRFADYVED